MALDGSKDTQPHRATWVINAMMITPSCIQITSLAFLGTMLWADNTFLYATMVFLHDSLFFNLPLNYTIYYNVHLKKYK